MSNWWIDESYYPGPMEEPRYNFDYLRSAINRIYYNKVYVSKFVFAKLEKELKGLGIASKSLSDYLKSMGFEVVLPPKVEKPVILPAPPYSHTSFREDMTLEERKEHALLCRKNRNTGPSIDWAFSRDGKKIH